MFSYEHNDEPILNEKNRFGIDYFLVVVNQSIESINKLFEQLESYSNNFGFLYQIGKVKTMDEVKKYCKDLHLVLFDGDLNNLEGLNFYSELLIFRMMVDDNTT
jgi:histidyl-tRNA synthetase